MLENLRLSERYDGFIFLAESARNPPILKPHHHQELELNVVRRGEITYVVRGQRYRFGQRSLLWMYPAQEHQLVDRSDDAEYYVAVFKPQLIADACRSSQYEGLKRENFDDGVLHTILEPESFDLMRKTMDAALEGSLDPDILNREGGFGVNSADFRFEHGDPDALNAGLRYILLLCWRCQRAGKAVNHAVSLHPAVQRALTLLREPEGGESLARLARVCGVSEAYLSRIFARQVGVPLNRYRNSVRLARFWNVYHAPPQKTLTEAVYAAGFGSYAQFYKVFTQSYGRGPRASLALR
jgi:methylphosphotriester-DNA--protein-cysteine methyltransferase